MIDKHRSGRTVEVSTAALETRIDTVIQEEQRITVEDAELQVSLAQFITLSTRSSSRSTVKQAQDGLQEN